MYHIWTPSVNIFLEENTNNQDNSAGKVKNESSNLKTIAKNLELY